MVGGGVLFLIAEGYYRLRHEEGLGMGDVKMLAMIGAFIGWQLTLLSLMLASFAGTIIGVAMIATGRGTMKYALPFGTFLAIGAAVSGTVGQRILDWYLSQWYDGGGGRAGTRRASLPDPAPPAFPALVWPICAAVDLLHRRSNAWRADARPRRRRSIADHVAGHDVPALERCLELRPDDVELMADLGAAYEQAGQWDRAESVYRRALAIDAEDGDIRVRLGNILLRRGDAAGARREAVAALAVQPGRARSARFDRPRRRGRERREGSLIGPGRSSLIALARVLNTAFFFVTSVYCLLAYSPFTYEQFIKPSVSAALSGFAVWHAHLHLLVLSITALTLAPYMIETARRAPRGSDGRTSPRRWRSVSGCSRIRCGCRKAPREST